MDFSFDNVTLKGGFLKEKQEMNIKSAIGAVYDRFTETGRFAALDCKWTPESEDIVKPHFFWDSDVAKWMEGAAYIIAKTPDKELEAKIEKAIDSIEQNQLPDGYFNCYYNVMKDKERFTERDDHELYCAGHLMEAAVAYYYATGKDRFLKIMEKFADLINKIFIGENSAQFATPGHEEIEIALFRMYKCTGKEKYLDMCHHFILARGNNDKDAQTRLYDWAESAYNQSNTNVYELKDARGHAVRACYLYSAMADLAGETGDERLMESCRTLFGDIVNRKMYITGGIGSTHVGEAFTIPYDLPAETSYAETCAAIALMYFAQRMLEAEPRGIYADTVERVMYNAMISGVSISGDLFFYENVLEINLSNEEKNNSTKKRERFPINQRVKVFGCSCCPPNINRVLASLERYIYHRQNGIFFVDQYCESEYKSETMSVIQKTNYPSGGKIVIEFSGVQKAALRIPSWCDNFTLNVPYELKDGYAYIENPATVELCLEMAPKLYGAHMEVNYCANKAAMMIGPVVYCAESVDNNVNLHRVYLSRELKAQLSYCDFCKLNTAEVDGYVRKTADKLYSALTDDFEKVRIKLIPYYAYANRGKSDMLVWMNYR